MKKTIALVLVFCSSVSASPRRHWYKDKKFWIGIAAIGATLTVDGKTSCDGFRRGAVEATGIGRGTRSCGVIIGKMAGAFAFYSATHAYVYSQTRDASAKWALLGDLEVPVPVVIAHGTAALHNAEIVEQRENVKMFTPR